MWDIEIFRIIHICFLSKSEEFTVVNLGGSYSGLLYPDFAQVNELIDQNDGLSDIDIWLPGDHRDKGVPLHNSGD